MSEAIGRRTFMSMAAPAALSLQGMLLAKPKSALPPQDAATGLKRIAIEEHWTSKELVLAGEQRPRSWLAETRLPTSPEKLRSLADVGALRLSDMDKAGIAMQVVAVGSSPAIQALTDASAAVSLAKKSNALLAEMIRKHPDRFAGFAALPTQDPRAAADELERAVKRLGFKGAMIQGRTNGECLDDRKYWVLWENAAALEAPIYLHPADPPPDIMKMYDGRPELLGNTWAWGVETATHALRIVGSGVFDAFPKATLILGHLGESLPYLLGRFDEGYSSVAPAYKTLKKKTISAYIRENILVTTSGLYQPEALVCAISAMGADRVLFATDYPWVDTPLAVEAFDKTPMSDAVREKVSYRNAQRWLRL